MGFNSPYKGLNNKHELANIKQTIELLKPRNKGVKMNMWESSSTHILHTAPVAYTSLMNSSDDFVFRADNSD